MCLRRKRKVTLLFGAGASIPFFADGGDYLTTSYLTKQIRSIENWHSVIDKLNSTQPDTQCPSAENVLHLIDRIFAINADYNFEQCAEIIDKIASINSDETDKTLLNVLLRTLGYNVHNEFCWNIVPFLFREIIAQSIMDLHDAHKVTDYDKLCRLQYDFLCDITGEYSQVSIASLNYDEVLLDSIYNEEYGHSLGITPCLRDHKRGGTNLLYLDTQRFLKEDKVIYFPHGHLRLIYTDISEVGYLHDVHNADNQRWNGEGVTCLQSDGVFATNYNTFITTGQTKDDALNLFPYSVYYQRLAIDCANSDAIVIIGYSFSDQHINRLLGAFLQDPMHKLYVVDFYEKEVTMVDEYQEENNLICKINRVVRCQWNIKVDSKSHKEPMEDDIESINSNGYGFIFDNVVLYKKGYEEFLKEYSWIFSHQYPRNSK